MTQPSPPMLVRTLSSFEHDLVRDHLLRLDKDARHARFCAGTSDTFVRAYAAGLKSRHVILFGCFVSSTLRGLCEIAPLASADEAEIALSVETPFQKQGCGTALLDTAMTFARNRRIRRLLVNALAENRAIRALFAPCDAKARIADGAYEAEVKLAPPDPTSVARETLDEALVWPHRWLVLLALRSGEDNARPPAVAVPVRPAGGARNLLTPLFALASFGPMFTGQPKWSLVP